MPDTKELMDDIEKWIQSGKVGDTSDLKVFGKKVLLTIVEDKPKKRTRLDQIEEAILYLAEATEEGQITDVKLQVLKILGVNTC